MDLGSRARPREALTYIRARINSKTRVLEKMRLVKEVDAFVILRARPDNSSRGCGASFPRVFDATFSETYLF